jgi:transcriptional regulator with XRE-family HTH domain
MDPRAIRFSQFLRHWRSEQNLKLMTAAKGVGVSVSAWDHWETGRRVPSLTNLLAIADFLKIPAQCLICAKNETCSIPHDRKPCEAQQKRSAFSELAPHRDDSMPATEANARRTPPDL